MALKQGVQYTWAEDSIFSLNSQQFGILYNGLTNTVSSPAFQEELMKAQKILALMQIHGTLNEVLESAVNAGIAIEKVQEGDESQTQKEGSNKIIPLGSENTQETQKAFDVQDEIVP